jgi:hypothetical protein
MILRPTIKVPDETPAVEYDAVVTGGRPPFVRAGHRLIGTFQI